MRKYIFILNLLLSILAIPALPAWSTGLSSDDILQSEEFLRKKAEIRYTRVGYDTVREIYISGLRITDQSLAILAGSAEQAKKIDQAIASRRTNWGIMTGIGIPVGGLLIFLSASQRTAQFSGNDPFYGNNGYYRQQNVSPGIALLGVLGAVATLYGVVNSINLLNDLTGLNSPPVLENIEAEKLIGNYNEKLKKELFQKFNTGQIKENLNGNISFFNISATF